MQNAGAVLIAAALLCAAQTAAAQGLGMGTGAMYERYSFSDPAAVGFESVHLLVVPFAARHSVLGGRLGIELSSSHASAAADRADGSAISVSGMTDTRLRTVYRVPGDRVVLSTTLIAPTGSTAFSRDEAALAGLFAADLLPTRVSHWGGGGGLAGSVSYAASVAGFGVGIQASGRLSRGFEPLDEPAFEYRPGHELGASIAIDRTVGRSGTAAIRLGIRRYGEDAVDGRNLYQSGNRYHVNGSYVFPVAAAGTARLYAGAYRRARGLFLEDPADRPAQDLLVAGAAARFPVAGVVIRPRVDGRVLRRADGVGQGFVTGFGGTVEVPAGPLVLVPGVAARFGSAVVTADRRSAITGFEASLVTRLQR